MSFIKDTRNDLSDKEKKRTQSFASKLTNLFKKKESEISWPTDFRLTSHIDFDMESGFINFN